MKGNIEKIENLEGGSIGVYLIIRPITPVKEEFEKLSIFKKEVQQIFSLHLGKAELTQEGK